MAAGNGHAECIRLLLDAGAEVDKAYHGFSPLHFACIEGHSECAKLLSSHGASREARAQAGIVVTLDCPSARASSDTCH